MTDKRKLNGQDFARLLRAGAQGLQKHAREVDDLNVFPIPDGDTGSNMLLTVMGGVHAIPQSNDNIGEVSRCVADGMLLSARGNSGVILSQLFDGMAKGLEGLCEADTAQLRNALKTGVDHAYRAVLVPTEGTILTVARTACEYISGEETESVEDYCNLYISEARRTLEHTPEMLPVLKKAGVVDSGGAGLVYIIEGIYNIILGKDDASTEELETAAKTDTVDFNAFTEDSVLEFGYCTELLLRLQNAKTSPADFDVRIITDYLQNIGDSVVAFKTGSIVKIHVHTMTPHRVLRFCQQYGEFLTVKIENMSLQHNSSEAFEEQEDTSSAFKVTLPKERKKYGIVAVCSGEGVKQIFTDIGADVLVDGGQSMNPSAEDFINAAKKINAEHIIILPNNSNVILAAKQAAELYSDSAIHVLESKTIGEGYAALSMLNTDAESVEELMSDLSDAMSGVVTAEVSHCIRDAEIDGVELHIGDYIGVVGKNLVASNRDRFTAVCDTVDKLGFGNYDICILIRGKDASADEAEKIYSHINGKYPAKEAYVIDGEQDVYDYILILQ